MKILYFFPVLSSFFSVPSFFSEEEVEVVDLDLQHPPACEQHFPFSDLSVHSFLHSFLSFFSFLSFSSPHTVTFVWEAAIRVFTDAEPRMPVSASAKNSFFMDVGFKLVCGYKGTN